MLNDESQVVLSEILEKLAYRLDVTETEYDKITKSYEAVGQFLSEGDSIKVFKPSIHPQGSFLLGTVVRPICDGDDLDIDLVCELERIPYNWTQFHLKNAVGTRLKESVLYRKKLDDEGKRCWTLYYDDVENKYHLDVLPSVVCENYYEVVRKYFSEGVSNDPTSLAIHITDRTRNDYYTETDKDRWLMSNPFGYAQWFSVKAWRVQDSQRRMLSEAQIEPVPKYSEHKGVLQRVVQLLKRHRDKMFDSDEDKPISIIITTLAAHSCPQGSDLYTALKYVAHNMDQHIVSKTIENGTIVRWVANPVNETENFADRWVGTRKGEAFDRWLHKLRLDLSQLEDAEGKGLYVVANVLNEMFGEKVSKAAVMSYANTFSESRENGTMRVSSAGFLGTTGVTAKAHNFYGREER